MLTAIRRKWKLWLAGFVVSIAVSIAWLVYDPCYCWELPPFSNIWSSDKQHYHRVHLRPGHTGCAVVTLPESWAEADAGEGGAGAVFYSEFRELPGVPDEVLLGFRSGPEAETDPVPSVARFAKGKYSIRFPSLVGQSGDRITDVRKVPDEVWKAGIRLQEVSSWDTDPKLSEFRVEPTGGKLLYRGKAFSNSDSRESWPVAMLSPSRSRIAVFSHYPRVRHGGNSTGVSPGFLTPPWVTTTIDIYDVPSGNRLSLVRFWTCQWRVGVRWLGDHLLQVSLGIEGQSLLCGFK